uniref:Uncharacterized protein n=1 Tax=Fagus sylvatica TaxID=28930 RepID=A0A2N9F0Y6_FAGSY
MYLFVGIEGSPSREILDSYSWSTDITKEQYRVQFNLLPDSLQGMNSPKEWFLSDCNLSDEAIPEDPGSLCSLQSLDLQSNCAALERMPNLSKISRMQTLSLTNFHKLVEIPGLDKLLKFIRNPSHGRVQQYNKYFQAKHPTGFLIGARIKDEGGLDMFSKEAFNDEEAGPSHGWLEEDPTNFKFLELEYCPKSQWADTERVYDLVKRRIVEIEVKEGRSLSGDEQDAIFHSVVGSKPNYVHGQGYMVKPPALSSKNVMNSIVNSRIEKATRGRTY